MGRRENLGSKEIELKAKEFFKDFNSELIIWGSDKFLKEYNIRTVPTVIRFGEEEFYENVDIKLEQFYEKFFNSETYPQTANPTLNHQYTLYDEIGKQGLEVLNVVISSGISTMNTSLRVTILPPG